MAFVENTQGTCQSWIKHYEIYLRNSSDYFSPELSWRELLEGYCQYPYEGLTSFLVLPKDIIRSTYIGIRKKKVKHWLLHTMFATDQNKQPSGNGPKSLNIFRLLLSFCCVCSAKVCKAKLVHWFSNFPDRSPFLQRDLSWLEDITSVCKVQ